MSIPAKIVTAARLALSGDFQTLRRQALVNAAERRLRGAGGKPFRHRDAGFPFVCHPDWPDSVHQFCENAGDHWEFEILRDWLRPSDTMIDIGANLGLYSFAAAERVKAGGRVIAVEAAPYVAEKLRISARVLDTPQVAVVEAAITSSPGKVTFYTRRSQSVTGEQSLRPPEQPDTDVESFEVEAITLAGLRRDYAALQPPAMIKIDIEGAEAGALSQVPADWLLPDGPFWIVEIHPGALHRFGATPRDVLATFGAGAFELWLLPKHPFEKRVAARPQLLRREALPPFTDSLYYNLFAIPTGSARQDRVRSVRRYFPAVP